MVTYSDGTRDCKGCGERQPLEEFWFENRRKNRRHYRCKRCHGLYIRDWVGSHQEQRRQAVQTYYRRHDVRFRRHGLDRADYDKILKEQGGVCAICGKEGHTKRQFREPWRVLDIDHDAITGRIRGLLCSACNTGIGKFQHDPINLAAAARYLRQARE